jgi:hypothetical protein
MVDFDVSGSLGRPSLGTSVYSAASGSAGRPLTTFHAPTRSPTDDSVA